MGATWSPKSTFVPRKLLNNNCRGTLSFVDDSITYTTNIIYVDVRSVRLYDGNTNNKNRVGIRTALHKDNRHADGTFHRRSHK